MTPPFPKTTTQGRRVQPKQSQDHSLRSKKMMPLYIPYIHHRPNLNVCHTITKLD